MRIHFKVTYSGEPTKDHNDNSKFEILPWSNPGVSLEKLGGVYDYDTSTLSMDINEYWVDTEILTNIDYKDYLEKVIYIMRPMIRDIRIDQLLDN